MHNRLWQKSSTNNFRNLSISQITSIPNNVPAWSLFCLQDECLSFCEMIQILSYLWSSPPWLLPFLLIQLYSLKVDDAINQNCPEPLCPSLRTQVFFPQTGKSVQPTVLWLGHVMVFLKTVGSQVNTHFRLNVMARVMQLFLSFIGFKHFYFTLIPHTSVYSPSPKAQDKSLKYLSTINKLIPSVSYLRNIYLLSFSSVSVPFLGTEDTAVN